MTEIVSRQTVTRITEVAGAFPEAHRWTVSVDRSPENEVTAVRLDPAPGAIVPALIVSSEGGGRIVEVTFPSGETSRFEVGSTWDAVRVLQRVSENAPRTGVEAPVKPHDPARPGWRGRPVRDLGETMRW